MRTLFDQSVGGVLSNSAFPRTVENGKDDLPDQQCAQNMVLFVQLEIQVAALQRLLAQRKLMIEEIHCLNERSKNIVSQALLESICGPTNF